MEPAFTDAEVRQFIGYLSAAIPELHKVEVPKLAQVWEEFKARTLRPDIDFS